MNFRKILKSTATFVLCTNLLSGQFVANNVTQALFEKEFFDCCAMHTRNVPVLCEFVDFIYKLSCCYNDNADIIRNSVCKLKDTFEKSSKLPENKSKKYMIQNLIDFIDHCLDSKVKANSENFSSERSALNNFGRLVRHCCWECTATVATNFIHEAMEFLQNTIPAEIYEATQNRPSELNFDSGSLTCMQPVINYVNHTKNLVKQSPDTLLVEFEENVKRNLESLEAITKSSDDVYSILEKQLLNYTGLEMSPGYTIIAEPPYLSRNPYDPTSDPAFLYCAMKNPEYVEKVQAKLMANMDPRELTVLVDIADVTVEVPLHYTPRQLKTKKINEFIEDVKTQYCAALETEEYKKECKENELDMDKLKKFNWKSMYINWYGQGEDLKSQRYTQENLNTNSVLYELLDRSKIDHNKDERLNNLELESLEMGYYPSVRMIVSSK